MRKRIAFLLPIILLASCGESSPIDEDTLFANFENKLISITEGMSSSEETMIRTIGYLAEGGGFFEMYTAKESKKTKYTYNESFLVETSGTDYFLDDNGFVTDSDEFVNQRYDNQMYFYEITDYQTWDDVRHRYFFEEEKISTFYSINFANEDIANIEAFKELREDKIHYEYGYTNFEGSIRDNKLIYSYYLKKYVVDTTGKAYLDNEISYTYEIKLENYKAASSTLKYENYTYTAGIITQGTLINLESKYSYSPLTEFQGTVIPY